jgi:O-acetyl-ADP-ribose deacetylase (regulator of RNase III)
MNKINYIVGDATNPVGDGNKIICHVCNTLGAWGRGFVLAISKRWAEPEKEYREWAKTGFSDWQDFELGALQLVQVEDDIWIANLIGQEGIRGRTPKEPPIRYEAIRSGLKKLRNRAEMNRASVHMPRIGCGLAGGKWEEIEPIIQEELVDNGVPVIVYDFTPDSR